MGGSLLNQKTICGAERSVRSEIERSEHLTLARHGRAFWSLGGSLLNQQTICGDKFARKKLSAISILVLSLLIILISLSSFVSAIGVVPGYKNVVYSKQDITYEMKVINDEGLTGTYDVEASGDLAQYIKLSKKEITFTSSQSQDNVGIIFSLPADASISPGEYTIRIVVKEQHSQTDGMMALVGVVSKLTVTIPGDGAFIQANVLAPNFIKGNTNAISIDVTNKGTKDANDCFASVDIYTSLNAKVVSLTSDKKNLVATKSDRLVVSWMPNANNGMYLARATILCDGKTAAMGESTFSIGSPELTVESMTSGKFSLGGISKFNLVISSEWGEQINDVYADVEITKDKNSVFKSKTESVDVLPLEKVVLPLYVDTSNFAPGDYALYLTLHYLGKDNGLVYDMKMSTDKVVVTSLSGMVVGGTGGTDTSGSSSSSGGGSLTGLLIVAVIVIAIVNVVLVVRVLRKKKGK